MSFRAVLPWMILAATLIGCGTAKELPDEIPSAPDPDQRAGIAQPKVPKESHPGAKEIVDRAIQAHTQGNPKLLEKLKLSKTTAIGTIKLAVGPQQEFLPVPTQRILITRWPDEIRFSLQYRAHLTGTVLLILRGRLTWELANDKLAPNVNPEKAEQLMRTDGMAQHWLALLFPLVEARAVVFDPKKGVGDPPVDTVRLGYPELPPYTLTFDSKSGLLTRVDYSLADVAGPVLTEWMFAEHKPYDGVLLPTKLSSARTTDKPKMRDVVQEWTVDGWEFPEKLDDSLFEPPK